MDLDAVEARVDGVACRPAEVVDDGRDLAGLQAARRGELLDVAVVADLRGDAAVGAGDGRGAAGLERGGGDAADVPEMAPRWQRLATGMGGSAAPQIQRAAGKGRARRPYERRRPGASDGAAGSKAKVL